MVRGDRCWVLSARCWVLRARCWVLSAVLVLGAGCARERGPDAYGTVEADQVIVSAEVSGIVTSLAAAEGRRLEKDAVAAVIDVSQLTLEQRQIETQRDASDARAREAAALAAVARQRQAVEAAQREVLAAQRAVAARQYERTRRLFDQDAATAQQLDQAERDLRTLDEQLDVQARRIAAERGQVQAADARVNTARQDVRSFSARLSQLADRLQDADVKNPRAGTVLTMFVKEGELVQPGQRLYTIADLAHVDVRAYIDETQLASVRTGQPATVTFDAGRDRHGTLEGIVTWIASQAEFTPTPIQTREERTGLVYAVKIRVRNDEGVLKIGMPVDVAFHQAPQ
jgi:HlyD family secretion protein